VSQWGNESSYLEVEEWWRKRVENVTLLEEKKRKDKRTFVYFTLCINLANDQFR
jgi:hypothetical protein